MSGLLELSLRTLKEQRTRTLLTIAGMTLGVALFTGAIVTVGTSGNLLNQLVTDANGSADAVAISPGGGAQSGFGVSDLPAGATDAVRLLPDVAAVVPVLTLSSSVVTDKGTTTNWKLNQPPPAMMTGVDLDAASAVYTINTDVGRLPATGAAEVAISPNLAKTLALNVGDTALLDTPTGRVNFTVVGVLSHDGVGRVGRMMLTSIAQARTVSGRSGATSQLAVKLVDGTNGKRWVADQQANLPAGVVLEDAKGSLQELAGSVQTVTGALTAMGAGVVLIGGFLVYLTMSMAVLERTRLFGILTAVGAEHGQVRRLVLSEAALLGTISSALGLPLGIGVAVLVRIASSRLLAQAGEVHVALGISPVALALGAIAGIAASIAAALVPAWRASRLDPVEAIRGDAADATNGRPRSAFVGLGLLVVGVATLLLGESTGSLALGIALVLIGSITAVPLVIGPLASVVGAISSRLSQGSGEVAVLHLTKQKSRSAYTVGLLTVVMGLVIATAGTYTSIASGTNAAIDRAFGDDLGLEAASAFDPSFIAALRQVDGVREVTERAVTNGQVEHDNTTLQVGLTSVDPDTYFQVASFDWVSGDDASVQQALRAGHALIVPAGFAERLGVHTGDALTLRTPRGPVPFTLAGTTGDFNVPPTLQISRADAATLFGADRPQVLQLDVAPGYPLEQVRTRINQQLGSRATFIVSTADELKADVRAQIAAGTNGIFVLLALATVVGLLGLANTLAMNVVIRYREIGVLRAIGGGSRQIRGMVIVEATTLSAIAVVLSLPLGAVIARPMLDAVARGLGSWHVGYSFPWAAVPIVAAAGVIVAALAALMPPRRATHLDVDSILRFE